MPFALFFFAASLAALRRSSLYGAVVNLPFTAFVQCIPHKLSLPYFAKQRVSARYRRKALVMVNLVHGLQKREMVKSLLFNAIFYTVCTWIDFSM